MGVGEIEIGGVETGGTVGVMRDKGNFSSPDALQSSISFTRGLKSRDD